MEWLSDDGLRVFLVLTVIIGGGAAFLAGRGLAKGWKPYWRVFFYMALLAGAVRFFHYALFYETLLSLKNFIIDYIVVATAVAWGYRITRVRQMVEQYPWAYERVGLLWWRRRRELPAEPQG